MKFYWQFKNGSIAELITAHDHLQCATLTECYAAWDRSLGGFVFYER